MNAIARPIRFLWIAGLGLFMASAAGAGWLLNTTGTHLAPKAGAVSPSDGFEPTVVSFGLVDVEDGVLALVPTQQGRVVEVRVKENQTVEAEAVLLRLDDRPARLRVAAARADLKGAQGLLELAKRGPEQQRSKLAQQRDAIEAMRQQLAAARVSLQQVEEYRKTNNAKDADVSTAAARVKQLEAGLRAEQEKLQELNLADPAVAITRAEADVEAKQALLEQAEYALEQCTLKAPAAGTVLRLHARVGDVFSSQAQRPALQFCPAGPRIVRAELEQEFAARVSVGMRALIQDDATGGGSWRGRVARIADSYSPRRSLQEPFQFNDVRTLECILELDPDQPPLRLNQRVRVRIGQERSR